MPDVPDIRVAIIDDHAIVRAGIRRLLDGTPGIEVVAEAPDGRDAAALVAAHLPDVVLMDLSMPIVDGTEATRAVMAAAPDSVVLVLTSFAHHDEVLRALDAGAAGYVLKDAEPDQLVAAIRSAAAGDAPIDPRAARALLLERRAPDPTGSVLTDRERDVLDAVRRGLPNKLIARELGIAEKTVKAHLTRVFQALGVSDRTQAALWAERERATGSGEG